MTRKQCNHTADGIVALTFTAVQYAPGVGGGVAPWMRNRLITSNANSSMQN